MNAKALLVVLLLVATAIASLVASPAARGATFINDQLVEERGATSALGRGDHVFVRFGSDAAFGIVYGTTANPNNIYIVAIKARYLGVAQVVDQQGRSVVDNRPIKIYTLYAMKLDSLVEFRDLNANSVADYARVYNSSTNRLSDYVARGDTLYKKVDLNTSWTAGPLVRSNGSGYRSWTFDLSARNLSYSAVANYTGSVAGVLPLVRFTFHLNASLEQVTNVTVPQWKVTVGAAGNAIANISRMTDLLVNGKAVHYDLKWDQDIEGWTFAAGNAAGNARRILLEIGAIVGNFIPAALADIWLENHLLNRMGEAGNAQFNSTTGAGTANQTTGTFGAVRRLQTPNVDFGANWTRIGRFVWVGNSVVDGVTRAVFGQIVAGFRFVAIGDSGTRFIGFVLLAGLSFRGGASIVHDPTVTTDIQADLQLPGSAGPGTALVLAVIATIAVLALIGVVVILVTRRRGREMPPPPPPPET